MTEVVSHAAETGIAPASEQTPVPPPVVRTALLSTRRLAALFPEPALDSDGRPESSGLDRASAALRRRARLLWTRALFRLGRVVPTRQGLVQLRMKLRLTLLRLRHARRLRP
jgi:hypothetical protein